MKTLILLRHGQSTWNQENRFTGWADVELTAQGIAEARLAGQLLSENGFQFDLAYTSVLKRAIHTLEITLKEMGQRGIATHMSWRLNERHYGALQGLNKAETAAKFGNEQVHLWRRSYDVPPPALELADERHPSQDPRYQDLVAHELPQTECLKDTLMRVVPYWNSVIAPNVAAGKRVIISAHGNSLRALIKHLENISESEILTLNIPNGIPLIFELTDDLIPIRRYYLDGQAQKREARQETCCP